MIKYYMDTFGPYCSPCFCLLIPFLVFAVIKSQDRDDQKRFDKKMEAERLAKQQRLEYERSQVRKPTDEELKQASCQHEWGPVEHSEEDWGSAAYYYHHCRKCGKFEQW